MISRWFNVCALSFQLIICALASGVARADTINFESLPMEYHYGGGQQNLGNYFSGVHFGPAVTVLDASVPADGYNAQGYPPRSGTAVAFSIASPTIEVEFDTPASEVSFWYSAYYEERAEAVLSDGTREEIRLPPSQQANRLAEFRSRNVVRLIIYLTPNYFSFDDLHFEFGGTDALPLYDPDERPVVGTVCDNLPDLQDKNYLYARVPTGMSGVLVDVTDANGRSTDGERNNVGSASVVDGRIVYFPPNEFNWRQVPREGHPEDVTLGSTRKVFLRVSGQRDSQSVSLVKEIVLARPPVVLVHGINSGPRRWEPLRSRFGYNPLTRQGIPFVTVNHSNPSAEGDFRNGNGPVELGAYQLSRRIARALSQVRAGEALTDPDDANSPDNDPTEVRRWEQSIYQGLPLSARRVDVVAWSYGGVISRWYIASRDDGPDSYAWYTALDNVPASPRPKSDFVSDGRPIRKLITLGSMWRGVPLVNYLNEALFPPGDGIPNLGQARMYWPKPPQITDAKTVAQSLPIKTNVPSMRVMAIESPWLAHLIYRDPFRTETFPAIRPFDDEVAYGSVAGDDSNYPLELKWGPLTFTPAPDIYWGLDLLQQPSRFPYLALERRERWQLGDYTDGLVPVWSAAIPGSYTRVFSSHDKYPADPDAQEYIARQLSSAALPSGEVLNVIWRRARHTEEEEVRTEDGSKVWEFDPLYMAPHPQNFLYVQGRDHIGRIAPMVLWDELQPLAANVVSSRRQGRTVFLEVALRNTNTFSLVDVRVNEQTNLGGVAVSGLIPTLGNISGRVNNGTLTFYLTFDAAGLPIGTRKTLQIVLDVATPRIPLRVTVRGIPIP